MDFLIRDDYSSAWLEQIVAIHNKTELKRTNPDKVERAFKNSFAVVSCWKNDQLIGIGRMISDGEMYAGIFDVVVDPEFQKMGVGKAIMNALISKVPQACIHLTSTFGNEEFYRKLGFKKHKTAMALYPEKNQNSPYLEQADSNQFVLRKQ